MSRSPSLVRVLAASIAAAALAADAFAANQVLIADANAQAPIPPGVYGSLQAAINAAADGDIIRVKPGTYPVVTIDSRSLTIIGEPIGTNPGELVEVQQLIIRNVAANQKVVLREMRMKDGWIHFQTSFFRIDDNPGPVILEDVVIPPPTLPFFLDLPALRVRNSAHVMLIRCDVEGRRVSQGQGGLIYPLGTALSISSSTLFAYRSSIQGGRGVDAGNTIGPFGAFNGGPGVLLVSGSLLAAGTTIQGGAGGAGLVNPNDLSCLANGNGGTGLIVGGVTTLSGATVAGGSAGLPAPGCPSVGVDGAAILQPAGVLTVHSAPTRSVEVSAPIVLGSSAVLTLDGIAGDSFVFLLSTAPSVTWVPSLQGALLGQLPAVAIALGSLTSTGPTSVSIPVPADGLPPGIGGVELYNQAFVIGADGDGSLSAPSATAVVH